MLPKQWLLGIPLTPAVHDELVGVEAHIVRQLEGPHGVSRPQLHGGVHILDAGVSPLHHPDRLHDVGDQEPVDNEPGGVLARNSVLAYFRNRTIVTLIYPLIWTNLSFDID